MLERNVPDIPFSLCWANENWTRRWDGKEQEVLVAQQHSDEDDEAVIADLIRYFRHPNYIRVHGKPFFAVYRPGLFPDIRHTLGIWRRACRKAGIGEIYLTMVESFEQDGARTDPATLGFDASIEFPAHTPFPHIGHPPPGLRPDFRGDIFDYRDLVLKASAQTLPGWTRFRGLITSWDNTARRQLDSRILTCSSPGAYQAWLETVIKQTREQNFGDERMVFINAWNEWSEGAHLEPDRRYGYGFLEATRNAQESWIFSGKAAS
jgi:lipopolysaccharide biosynthesis protein